LKSDRDVTGILVVDKPAGITSHDVVDKVRRIFRTRRVGHTGTLDPDATGVLVLCLGRATRLADYLSSSSKHYRAEFVFGIRTDTMDASGTTISDQDASGVSRASIESLLDSFRGKIVQVPPMVSARHHEGRRLYELAREGVTVPREGREVLISELELTDFYPGEHPRAVLEVTCSTGTYIRVLSDDLGNAAGIGAHMSALRRTWVGSEEKTAFTLQEARTIAELEALAESETVLSALLPIADGLRAVPHLQLRSESLVRLRHGQSVAASEVTSRVECVPVEASRAAVLDDGGEVCALVRWEAGMLRPLKVIAPL